MNWLDILGVGAVLAAAVLFVVFRIIRFIRHKRPSCCG
jgi:hypothetical protein